MIKAYTDGNGTHIEINGMGANILSELYAISKGLIECHIPRSLIIRTSSEGIVAGLEELEKQENPDCTFTTNDVEINPDVLKAIFGENPFKKSDKADDTFNQLFGDLFDK